ncbi:RNA-binding protein [Treponema sp.]|uniref:RNA recognition motif domain-containing protein n=1 Tax=Treponema sp. TaxID=166 RepID=UPI00298ECB48|nr:RNA-binding protein [Treponema sp.]MCQ2240487.1 RNA-binding protein [Treponema sp.]
MSKRIYIGNLSYTTTEERLTELFSEFGEVISASIIKDRDTSQSKGFGFVELSDEADSDGAISRLSGKEVDGRRVRVNYAEEKREGTGRNFGRDRNDRGDRSFRGENRDRNFRRNRSDDGRNEGRGRGSFGREY